MIVCLILKGSKNFSKGHTNTWMFYYILLLIFCWSMIHPTQENNQACLTRFFLSSCYIWMHRKPPDLELEGLFKRHFTTVKFYQGSIMSTPDLQRVKVYTHQNHQNIRSQTSSSKENLNFVISCRVNFYEKQTQPWPFTKIWLIDKC